MSSKQTTTYIAFLRAINVGGRNITMERLRAQFCDLGFTNVRSYIQTGNVFFDTTESHRALLTSQIEEYLYSVLGYKVPTMLRTLGEVESALQLDPFRDVVVTPDVRLCVAFLSAPLPETLALPHVSPKTEFEILKATQTEAFVVVRLIGGSPGNLTVYLEKAFHLQATVRFHATSIKILQAARLNREE